MNIAPISEPNTITPAHAATQKIRRARDVEVVERDARRAAGAARTRRAAASAIAAEPERERRRGPAPARS